MGWGVLPTDSSHSAQTESSSCFWGLLRVCWSMLGRGALEAALCHFPAMPAQSRVLRFSGSRLSALSLGPWVFAWTQWPHELESPLVSLAVWLRALARLLALLHPLPALLLDSGATLGALAREAPRSCRWLLFVALGGGSSVGFRQQASVVALTL